MRNGAPFSKPRVRLYGKTGDAQQYLGAAYNLLFKVRQFCEASGVPVFAMQHTLENGAVVQAAILGDEEIVSCFPPTYVSEGGAPRRKRLVRKPLANFYAVPSSQAHKSGYVPQHPGHPDNTYPGPVSVWEEYNTYHVPPDAAPKASDSKNAEMRPAYELEDRPGVVTWWTKTLAYNELPVVLSWVGVGRRYGKFGSRGVAPAPSGFHPYIGTLFHASQDGGYGADVTGLSNIVWINGVRLQVDRVVWSAAIRDSDEGRSLIFVSGTADTCYVTPIPKGVFSGETQLTSDLVLPPSTLVAQRTRGTNEQPVFQHPFINASATKCVLLVDEPVAGELGGWQSVLKEWDFASGQVRTVFESTIRIVIPSTTVSASGARVSESNLNDFTPAGESEFTDTLSRHVSQGSFTETSNDLLCADYVGDTLEYLLSRSKRTFFGGTSFRNTHRRATYVGVHIPPTQRYSITRTFEISWSQGGEVNPMSAEADIWSSTKGVLLKKEVQAPTTGSAISGEMSGAGSMTYEVASNQPIVLVTHDTTGVVSIYTRDDGSPNFSIDLGPHSVGGSTEADGSMRLDVQVLCGDLRHNALLFEFVERTNVDPKLRASSLLFNQNNLSFQLIGNITGTSVERRASSVYFSRNGVAQLLLERNIDEPVSQTTSYQQIDEPEWPSGYAPELDGGGGFEADGSDITYPNTTVPSSAHYIDDKLYNYARFAASPDGQHMYYGFSQPKNWFEPSASEDAFIISGQKHLIPNETYAPGDGSTLAGAVFFGALAGKTEEIDEL